MRSFIDLEKSKFNALPADARRLLISTFAFSATVPLLSTFVNAYLWRESRQLEQVVLYTISMCLFMPLGFYCAGLLLRRFKHFELYAMGFVLQALSMLLVVSLANLTHTYVFLLGAFTGVSAGLYWSVRNILTIRYSSDQNRDYFFGTEASVILLCSVLLPLVFGVLLERRFFVGPSMSLQQAYWALLAIAVLIIALASFQILRAGFQTVHSSHLVPRKSLAAWRWARGILLIKGMGDAAGFILPALLTMTLIGEEIALGGLQSLCAVAGAVGIYLVGGRICGMAERLRLLRFGVLLMISAGIYLGLFYGPQSAAIFLLLQSLASAIFWNATNPLVYAALDQSAQHSGDYFAYNCEREIFLNMGRVLALLPLSICSDCTSDANVLKLFAVGVALFQAFLLPIAHRVARHIQEQKQL